jgi:hypothetical protein
MGNYKDAWTDVRGLIDACYPYPQHQGKTDITEVVEFARIAEDWNLTQKQYDRLIDRAQQYHDKLDKKAKGSKAEVGDVWTLETPNEELATEDLNMVVSAALDGHSASARNYLRKLWDNESWESIKEKLLTEGSAWYVWWMDGVRQHAANLARASQPKPTCKSGNKKVKRAGRQSPGIKGLRR